MLDFSFYKKKSRGHRPQRSWLRFSFLHLIPGVDDGVQHMDDALLMIRGLVDMGYKKIITTPHILWDVYPNTPEIIRAGHQEVAAEIGRKNIPVKFFAAAEYLMDDHFEDLLDRGEPLLTIKDAMVLVELSFSWSRPSNLKDLLFKMQIRGYLNPSWPIRSDTCISGQIRAGMTRSGRLAVCSSSICCPWAVITAKVPANWHNGWSKRNMSTSWAPICITSGIFPSFAPHRISRGSSISWSIPV